MMGFSALFGPHNGATIWYVTALLVLLTTCVSYVAIPSREDRLLYWVSWTGSVVVLAALTLSAILLLRYPDSATQMTHFRWVALEPSISFWFSLHVNLTAVLLAWVIACIALFVQVYFVLYTPLALRQPRYYAFMHLFVAAMLGLLVVNNVFWLFLCWSITGVCSYFLIIQKPKAYLSAVASSQALLMSKTGNLGFIIGMGVLWAFFSTLDIDALQEIFIKSTLVNYPVVVLYLSICSMLFVWSAMSKSAQFPFQSWLLRAMIAPTPISAFLHAATLVAAGVILLARLSFLFTTLTYNAVFIVGLITACIASAGALYATKIKQMLAFSTVSQVGLMFMLVGIEHVTEALLYFVAHAFFKCVLFLSVGAMCFYHQPSAPHIPLQMAYIQGMRRRTPVAFYAALIGTCSMAGLPFFSGYVLKKHTLYALMSQSPFLVALCLGVFVLTSLYSARLAAHLCAPAPHRTRPTTQVAGQKARMWGINAVLVVNSLACFAWWYTFPSSESPWLMEQLSHVQFAGKSWGYGEAAYGMTTTLLMTVPLMTFGLGFLHYRRTLRHARVARNSTQGVARRGERLGLIRMLLDGQRLYVMGEQLLSKLLVVVTFIEQVSGRYIKGLLLGLGVMLMRLVHQIEHTFFVVGAARLGRQPILLGSYVHAMQNKSLTAHAQHVFIILLIGIVVALFL